MNYHLAGFRYFEYGLLAPNACSVVIDWNYLPTKDSKFFPNHINKFLEWIETTFENTNHAIVRYKEYEWHVNFPGDRTNSNLLVFKLRWMHTLTTENSG